MASQVCFCKRTTDIRSDVAAMPNHLCLISSFIRSNSVCRSFVCLSPHIFLMASFTMAARPLRPLSRIDFVFAGFTSADLHREAGHRLSSGTRMLQEPPKLSTIEIPLHRPPIGGSSPANHHFPDSIAQLTQC